MTSGAAGGPRTPSRTALAAARHRAVHQLLEHGVLLDDPLAVAVTGLDPDVMVRDAEAHPDRRPMRLFVAVRSRLAEDVAADAFARGVRQLVLLGAGLDTFGYRNPHPGLRVVEVDHAASQAWKLERLAAARIGVPESVTHVAVDFEHDDLLAALTPVVDLSAPVLFWWLGVTPYLTRTAVEGTLHRLGSLASVAVVLDHATPVAGRPASEQRLHAERRASVAALGEPWLSELTGDEVTAMLSAAGFDTVTHEHEGRLIRDLLGSSVAGPEGPGHLAVATRGWPPPDPA